MRKKKLILDVYLNVHFYELGRLPNKQAPCGIAAFVGNPKSCHAFGQRMAVSLDSQSLIPLALHMVRSIMPAETRLHDNWKIRLHVPQVTLSQRIEHARADLVNGGRKVGVDGERTYALVKFKQMIELIESDQIEIIEHEKTNWPLELELLKHVAKDSAQRSQQAGLAFQLSPYEPFDELGVPALHYFTPKKSTVEVEGRRISRVWNTRALALKRKAA